jgi:hypothetical protein
MKPVGEQIKLALSVDAHGAVSHQASILLRNRVIDQMSRHVYDRVIMDVNAPVKSQLG